MKGNRPKIDSETLPDVEVVTHERRTEVRYSFSEISETDPETGETRTSFNFKYIKVYDLNDVQINDGLTKKFKKIINDPTQIKNPIAFNDRRWEELVCELEENQTIKDQLLNNNLYTRKALDMPAEGELVKKGNIYLYDGKHWGCRQTHNKMHYHPSKTPALFNFVPVHFDSSIIPKWQVGVAYNVDDHVMYNDREYNCLQAHTSLSTWTPDVTPALWEVI